MMAVLVSDEQTAVALDLPRCARLARLALAEERVPDDAGPAATDVLAFPIDEDALPGGRRPDVGGRGPGSPPEPEDPPVILGDVVICPTVAARQAPEHDTSFDDELALLVVHGILHLLNYDHAEEREAETMRRRERELLERFRESEDATP
jgi:probable rRNA maturation factor